MSAGDPKISVLLPFRDEASTLAQALRSLRRQSFGDIEVLCLDDGSKDGSSSIARQWSRMDPRIRWIPLQRRGIVPALNHGIGLARAPILARMDADDVSHPRRLELQWAYLRDHPGVGVVGCRVRAFPAAVVREGYRHYIRWLNGLLTPEQIAGEIFVECPLAHPTVLIRRRVLETVGIYRCMDGPEDYDLWLRCFLEGVKMAKIPQVLYFWRERPDRLSRSSPRYHRNRFWDLKASYLAAYLLRRADLRKRPILVWGQRLGGRLARCLMERGIHPVGFININRRRQGSSRLGLPIHPPDILSRLGGAFVICAVSTRGAREDIRAMCLDQGLLEGRDFLMAG